MKRLIVYVLFFFAAVAISPFLINEKGYILIAMGDITLESTVVTASILLVLLFIGLMFSLKVLKGGLNLGFGTWNKIAFAGKRRGLRNFNKAIACYALDDYKQAEHLFIKSAQASPFENTAYLLAASAAQHQNLSANTKHYLNQLIEDKNTIKELGLDSVLVKVKLLMDQQEFTDARLLVDQYHKHIGHDPRLLILEIELCIIEKRYVAVIDYLVAARKQQTIEEQRINQWEDIAFYQQFTIVLHQKDKEALLSYWQDLARKVKQRESVVFAYCKVLAENSLIEMLNDILLAPMKKDASLAFLKRVHQLPITKPDALILIVQKHLKKNNTSAKWLSTLGHLSASGQQWQMAEKSFNSLVNLPEKQYDNEDLACFANTLIAQEKHEMANQLYKKIIEQ